LRCDVLPHVGAPGWVHPRTPSGVEPHRGVRANGVRANEPEVEDRRWSAGPPSTGGRGADGAPHPPGQTTSSRKEVDQVLTRAPPRGDAAGRPNVAGLWARRWRPPPAGGAARYDRLLAPEEEVFCDARAVM